MNFLLNGNQTGHASSSFLRGDIALSTVDVTSFEGNTNGSFKQEQQRYPRVREAYSSKERTVKKLLARRGINTFRIDLFIRLFKKERLVEVWAKKEETDTFTHIVDYPFCRTSGDLGPKRREGDLQIPEGFYRLSYFNPASNYYLSLKIIKELYVFAVEAHSSGNARIPVHIFPGRLDEDHWQALKDEYSSDTSLINFWQNLRPGYLAFANNKQVSDINIDEDGDYNIK
ncbi:MAG: hypothetical protein BRD50_01180 [Bacteroidetes bacterium SW_11_45_7]|nr:MAG: hypothetical protein BRD50_01180 [Bacteroidetes bacterium SW_11_45_7]